jgi:ribosome biogenesis protein SSF1/2
MFNLYNVPRLCTSLFARAGYGSESEVDDEAATVSLASDVDKLNRASRKSAIRLQEIGPRMKLHLVKVEAGLCSGDVLYPQPG